MKSVFRSPLFRFIVILLVFLMAGAGLRGVYHSFPGVAAFVQHSWVIDTFYRVIVEPAGFLLTLSGVPHEVAYSLPGAQYFIKITETGYWLFLWIPCLGISLMYVYSSLVIAFPGSWKRKAAYVVFGCIAIQVLNILRFYGVAMLLAHDHSGRAYLAKTSWLVVNHEDVFNYFVIFLIFLMFVFFARKLHRSDVLPADDERKPGKRPVIDE